MKRNGITSSRGRARPRSFSLPPVLQQLSPATSTDNIAIPFINQNVTYPSETNEIDSATTSPENSTLTSETTASSSTESSITPQVETKADNQQPQVPANEVEEDSISVVDLQDKNEEPIQLQPSTSSMDTIPVPILNENVASETKETDSATVTSPLKSTLTSEATQTTASSSLEMPPSAQMTNPEESSITLLDETTVDKQLAANEVEETSFTVEEHRGKNGEPIQLQANLTDTTTGTSPLKSTKPSETTHTTVSPVAEIRSSAVLTNLEKSSIAPVDELNDGHPTNEVEESFITGENDQGKNGEPKQLQAKASSADAIPMPSIYQTLASETKETDSATVTSPVKSTLTTETPQTTASSSSTEKRSCSTLTNPEKCSVAPVDEPKVGYPQLPANKVEERDTLEGHQGQSGEPIQLKANFYRLNVLPYWRLRQYSVRFSHQVVRMSMRKKLFALAVQKFNFGYVFDGIHLFTAKPLEQLEIPMAFEIKWKDFPPLVVSLRGVHDVQPGSPLYVHVYSSVIQNFLRMLDLLPMGRHFFNPATPVAITDRKLELWPGYITSLRAHEGKNLLLSIELTHKVIHTDSMLETIHSLEEPLKKREKDPYRVMRILNNDIRDAIVMTTYNRKTYIVDHIDFGKSPANKFDNKGKQLSCIDYYKERHNIKIKDESQPLIVSKLKKKDEAGKETETTIFLIPELCQLTGLIKPFRRDFAFMKDLSMGLQVSPESRMAAINQLVQCLMDNDKIKKEFKNWGLQLDTSLIDAPGRTLANQNVLFANDHISANELSNDLRRQKLLSTVPLTKWVVIYPKRSSAVIEKLIQNLIKTAGSMEMKISSPLKMMFISDTRTTNYTTALDSLKQLKESLQLVFIILPNSQSKLYAEIKRRLTVDIGVPSQCLLAQKILADGRIQFAPKLVLQISAKLGGEPWSVRLPLKNTMFIGFDTYKMERYGRNGVIGAVVATYSEKFTKYFSITNEYKDPEDIYKTLGDRVKDCITAYSEENNGALPDMIFMYRGGVDEKQLKRIETVELDNVKSQLAKCYKNTGREPSRTYITVSSKMNVRLFDVKPNSCDNPPPGTVSDNAVTLPERYDFYLISGGVRQGTVSPNYYNIIYDKSGFSADRIQLISYRLCYLYFNRTGAARTPAPCQYARTLAFQAATAYSGTPNKKLNKLLYFL